MPKTGFATDTYLAEQTAAIIERSQRFGNKLYLEFGGKIAHDYHAARVLPGFDPNVKIRLLQALKDRAEILVCIYAGDIARKKMRADFGIPYDVDALKLIDDLREWGLLVRAVVVTRFEGQASARVFKARLERRGITVYAHKATRGYPTDVELIVSDEGYGANEYIHTERPIVVVTGPGPAAGSSGPACRSSTTSTAVGPRQGMPSSRRSRSGACPSSTRSTWRTRRQPSICATST